jgi:hypothetical protein
VPRVREVSAARMVADMKKLNGQHAVRLHVSFESELGKFLSSRSTISP